MHNFTKKYLLVFFFVIALGGFVYLKVLNRGFTSAPGEIKKDIALPAQENKANPKAVDFSFKNLEGDDFKLSDFKGKIIILNIRTTTCSACDAEVAYLKPFYQKIKDKEYIRLIPLFERESVGTVSRYVASKKIDFPVFLDNFGISAYKYRANYLPTTFIINKEFELVAKIPGVIDWSMDEVFLFLEKLSNE